MSNALTKNVWESECQLMLKGRLSYDKWKERGRPPEEYETGFGKPISELSVDNIETLASAHHDARLLHLRSGGAATDSNAGRKASGLARLHGETSDSYHHYIGARTARENDKRQQESNENAQ